MLPELPGREDEHAIQCAEFQQGLAAGHETLRFPGPAGSQDGYIVGVRDGCGNRESLGDDLGRILDEFTIGLGQFSRHAELAGQDARQFIQHGPTGTDTWLFGSRVDDNKRGGDIDLLLRPQLSDRVIARKLDLLRLLERQLGERKIDILIEMPDDTRPIVRLAHETGVLL